jgi:hypothetical protein
MPYHIATINAVLSHPDMPLVCELMQKTEPNGDAVFLVKLNKQFDHLNAQDCATLSRWRRFLKNELVGSFHPDMIRNLLKHIANLRKDALEMIREARNAQAPSEVQAIDID